MTVPYGYCHCGCGEKTDIARQNWAPYGWVLGEPFRYRPHHMKRPATFAYNVEDRGYVSPCWVWDGYIGSYGYGELSISNRRTLAHRHSYEKHVGPIPAGRHVDHLCHVRACVNPEHLEAVSPRENVWRQRNTKLTMEKAREIRQRLSEGERNGSLAKEFGVSPATISSIKSGQRWAEPVGGRQ